MFDIDELKHRLHAEWSNLVMRWSQQRFVNGAVVCQLVRKLTVDISNIVSESIIVLVDL